VVEIPGSNVKKAITQILMDQGYILNFKEIKDEKQGIIKIALKYNNKTKDSAIRNLTRISKPGLRKYTGVDSMPRVLNGLGIAIISTSKGLITDKEARKHNVGGEILCYVD
jgi:small subunit ribosomal protein S8